LNFRPKNYFDKSFSKLSRKTFKTQINSYMRVLKGNSPAGQFWLRCPCSSSAVKCT